MIQNGFPAAQAIGRPGIQFDSNQLRWLGTIAPVVETMAIWHTADVRSIDDARKKEIVAGATARGGITFTYPALMNELLGTKFKIVTGYSGGNEINIAMERGEVQGRNNSWSSWKVTKRPWLKERKLFVIAQAGAKAKDLDAPVIEDLVKPGADRQLVDLIMSGAASAVDDDHPDVRKRGCGRYARLPGGDEGPEFIAETAKLNIEIDPERRAMQKIVAGVLATPKAVAERARPCWSRFAYSVRAERARRLRSKSP
jgi:hypothetical protein